MRKTIAIPLAAILIVTACLFEVTAINAFTAIKQCKAPASALILAAR